MILIAWRAFSTPKLVRPTSYGVRPILVRVLGTFIDSGATLAIVTFATFIAFYLNAVGLELLLEASAQFAVSSHTISINAGPD